MGGSTATPPPPDPTLPIAQMQLATEGQLGQLRNQNELAALASKTPVEAWTPDIWSSEGAMAKQGQIAAINAFRSKQLEQQMNPEAAALRAQVPKLMQENLDPKHLQNQMNQWAKGAGLAQHLGTGLGDSTVGKSAFFDSATAEAEALRRRGLGEATNWLNVNQAPQAGIDASGIRAAEMAADQQALAQRSGMRNQGIGLAQSQSQSAGDWINHMMSGLSKTTAGWQQQGDRYVQSQIDAKNAEQERKTALIKAGIAAAATVATGGAAAPLLLAAGGSMMGGGAKGAGQMGMAGTMGEDSLGTPYAQSGAYRIS